MRSERFRIRGLLREVSHSRGKNSENRVQHAFEILKNEGKIDTYYSSPELDKNGVDFMVSIGNKYYKVQVKSSYTGVKIAQEKVDAEREDRLFVVPSPDETHIELAARFIRMLEAHERSFWDSEDWSR